jgi:hypothetical protein
MQDEFEQWLENPQGYPPLVVKPWKDPMIHWGERVKWLNTDKMREALMMDPQIEQVVMMHLQELQMILNPPMPVGPDGQPIPPEGQNAPGAGQAMRNSNRNSGGTDAVPRGNGQGSQRMGPV